VDAPQLEDRFDGTITARQALERSSNAAAVRLAQAAGLDGVIKIAREVGFTSRTRPCRLWRWVASK
jgi:membrane carboxypeptidase/penicillin-binding protein